MSEAAPKTIPIPREGFSGIQALIALGEDCLAKLTEEQVRQRLDLSFSSIFERLTATLECDRPTIQSAFFNALIPLNGLRRNLEMTPAEFIAALDHTVSERAPEEWKSENLASWKKIVSELCPFFEPDNFFAQVSKAFDLLSERPAIVRSARILTELRPVFNEDTSKTLAMLQTNTLALDYWDGERVCTLHITMDSDDLAKLELELTRAKEKIQVSKREASEKEIHFVAYGES